MSRDSRDAHADPQVDAMMRIGELAATAGESVKTLRYWTDLGLLEAERGDNGYRYYRPEMARRVTFIRSSQRLGFRLEEIRDVLTLRDQGLSPCDEVRDELRAHLDLVQSRIAELQALERELADRLAWAERNPDPDCGDDGCVYLTPEAASA